MSNRVLFYLSFRYGKDLFAFRSQAFTLGLLIDVINSHFKLTSAAIVEPRVDSV